MEVIDEEKCQVLFLNLYGGIISLNLTLLLE